MAALYQLTALFTQVAHVRYTNGHFYRPESPHFPLGLTTRCDSFIEQIAHNFLILHFVINCQCGLLLA
jgi:hypothetical protein